MNLRYRSFLLYLMCRISKRVDVIIPWSRPRSRRSTTHRQAKNSLPCRDRNLQNAVANVTVNDTGGATNSCLFFSGVTLTLDCLLSCGDPISVLFLSSKCVPFLQSSVNCAFRNDSLLLFFVIIFQKILKITFNPFLTYQASSLAYIQQTTRTAISAMFSA